MEANEKKKGFSLILHEAIHDGVLTPEEVYAGLCNVVWIRLDDDRIMSYSWRAAGDFVAHLTEKGGDYLDYYCGGKEGKVSKAMYDLLTSHRWWPYTSYDRKDLT